MFLFLFMEKNKTTLQTNASIRRQFYGNLGQNAGMLLRDFQIPTAVSYALASEMKYLDTKC